jgi:acyl carrier protein
MTEPLPPSSPLSDDDIADEVRRIVSAQLGLAAPPEDDELAARLDSIQRMGLVVAIEDRFRVCFSPEDDERARTLADLITIVQEHSRAARG